MIEAIVEHDYNAKEPDELTIKKGDVIKEVVNKQEGWCEGVLDGRKGLFPDNFVVLVQVKMRANANSATSNTNSYTNIRKCKVVYSYKQEHEDELTLNLGDVIEVVGEEEEGWWKGRINGKVGVFPSNFVEEIPVNNVVPQNQPQLMKETNGKEDVKSNDIVPVPVKEDVKSNKILCEVKYAYQAQNSDELTLKEGDILTLISKDGQDAGWWRGELDGKVGVFPDNFVVLIERPENDDRNETKRPSITKHAHVASQRRSPDTKTKIESSPPTPLVPAKKPSVPFKPSTGGGISSMGILNSLSGITKKIADTIDGGASSKSVKINNDIDLKKEPTESFHMFDNIARNPVLSDPRATRVKGPSRRPASVVVKDGESLINGNSDYGSLEDAAPVAMITTDKEALGKGQGQQVKPKGREVPKVPWLHEIEEKMNKRPLDRSLDLDKDLKDKELSPTPDMSKSMPSTMFSGTRRTPTPTPTVEKPSESPKPEKPEKPDVKQLKTPPNELERTNSIEKVVLRNHKPIVNNRPQTIDTPTSNRPVAKTSPTIHQRTPSPSLSPSPSGKPPIADRSSIEMVSSRHFNDMCERMAALEAELQKQRVEYLALIDDLKGRLQVETDMRMLLQVELEKLQAQQA